jgi:DUF2075 family protein
MTAGYCWPWSNPQDDGTLVPDVQVGDWAKPWNVRGERAVGGAPPAALWAARMVVSSRSAASTPAQGFEYDWNGVLFGPDFVWRTDRWVIDRSANKDPDFRNRSKVSDHEFERLVRNVYKVLLTRGMVGTVITSVDPETQELLDRLVRADAKVRA